MKKSFTLAEVLMPKQTSGMENEILHSRESKTKEPSYLRKKFAAFTLAEVLMPKQTSGMENEILHSRESEGQGLLKNTIKHCAFTLAEVLVTLAIIGVVAALIIATTYSQYQKMIFKTQYKHAQSEISKALALVIEDLKYRPDCYYKVTEDNHYASSVNLPGQCRILAGAMKNRLKITKMCDGDAYANGCTPYYSGIEKAYEEGKPKGTNATLAQFKKDCPGWNESTINGKLGTAWVLNDGTIIVFYVANWEKTDGSIGSTVLYSLFAVDVNGKKGPNKWGYDLIPSQIISEDSPGILRFRPSDACYAYESGGMDMSEFLK